VDAAVKARANTTVSILRATAADDYGDEQDLDKTVASRVPASILEIRRTTSRTDSTTPQRVRSLVGRLGAGTDVQLGDRVRDERTATIYIVDDVTEQRGLFGRRPDMRLDLRQVD
jgi:hypothetical protein